MAFTQLTADVENISKLDNYPPDDVGMTSAILKARFDKSSVDIKTYINETLIPELEGGYIKSFSRTSGDGSAGTDDTYTITYQDDSTDTFTVHNGANGTNGVDGAVGATGAQGIQGIQGDGDMSKSEYDPNSRATDVFNRANHTGTQTISTLSDFPSTMPPASHTHGNITNDGKIGSTADLPVFTTTSGTITTKSASDAKTILGVQDNYVKLLSSTVAVERVSSVSLDLSGIDTSIYSSFFVASTIFTISAGNITCELNGLSSGYSGASLTSGSTSVTSISGASCIPNIGTNATNSATSYGIPINMTIRYSNSYSGTSATNYRFICVDFAGGMTMGGYAKKGFTVVQDGTSNSSKLTSVTFYASSDFVAGSSFIVYGVKK